MIDLDILRDTADVTITSYSAQWMYLQGNLVLYMMAVMILGVMLFALVRFLIPRIGGWTSWALTLVVMTPLTLVVGNWIVNDHRDNWDVDNERRDALNAIAAAIKDDYAVDAVRVEFDNNRELGSHTDAIVAAVEETDPAQLPTVAVSLAGEYATYGVSFDNETGEATLHNTAIFGDYPDPETLRVDATGVEGAATTP